MLCSIDLLFVADVLGQPIGPVLKLEDGTDGLSQNIGN